MALLNIVPFDLNRRPGRPNKIVSQRGSPKTTATAAVHKTPEQRPTVNQSIPSERRGNERRNRYKPMAQDRRAGMRRNLDLKQTQSKTATSTTTSHKIDIKV
jgi:hypothetical protein